MGKKWKQWQIFFSWAPKSLQTVIAAMKLKDTCSLEENLWQNSVEFSSVAQSCPTLCDPMSYSTPGFLVHHQLLELNQTHVHQVGDAIPPFHPLSSPSPPTFNLSQHQGLFKWVSSLPHVAEVLEFQLQRQSFQWIFGIKGLLRVFSNTTVQKASILWCSSFFMVQLLYPYMTTGKTIALTIWTFVSKVMSLLFNTLSRLVIAFLTRSKHPLISWLHSPSTVIFVSQENSLSLFPLFSHLFAMKWWDQMPWS